MAILQLATVDDVLVYPKMDTVSTGDKLWLERLIRAFSVRAEKCTGREFYTEARTRTFSGTGIRDNFQLPAFGVSSNSITSVHEDADRVFGASTLTSTDTYWFDYRTGILKRESGTWLKGNNVIRVIWIGGLGTSTEDVPDDLRVAAVMQVVFWWQRRNELGLQAKNLSGGSVTISAPSKLLPEVEEVLSSYEVPW